MVKLKQVVNSIPVFTTYCSLRAKLVYSAS